ncbi:MAG TPA: hypothetical protein PLP19_18825 [bacterium]|nr:hypothetical protein [bacterium]HPN45551.1 hypothetical protein [bacterium]
MNTDIKGMRSIWFFVGLILTAIGIIVLAAGIFELFYPANPEVRLAGLHANIWWGGLIIIFGLIYTITNKNKYV